MRNIILKMCLILIFGPVPNVTTLADIASEADQINFEDSVGLFEMEEGTLPSKLINPEDIIGPLEQGAETVKVIVNLVEPPQIMSAIDQHAVHSPTELREQIAAIQAAVFYGLSTDDFKLRHRYHNFASFSGEVTPAGLAKLLNDPIVESIEPVYLRQMQLRQGISLINGTRYRSRYSGTGVAIAICDTGIDYTHPKLGGATLERNTKVIDGNDVADGDGDPMPIHYHGTACAGIAAGDRPDSGENTGDYIGGVAPDARLCALKMSKNSDPTHAFDEDIIKAWDWCVDHNNADPEHPIKVISTSFGYGQYTMPMDQIKTEGWEILKDTIKPNLPWITPSPAWQFTSGEKHSGSHARKAGKVTNPGIYSIIQVELDCEQGIIKFWRKVSSREGSDWLAFYIDDMSVNKYVDRWSGERQWEMLSYPVTEGMHTFRWAYFKDSMGSVGQDTAWIDDITFPLRWTMKLSYPRAANSAVAAGITVVVASGNNGYCDAIGLPAALSQVISVGAVYDGVIGLRSSCIMPESCIGYPCSCTNGRIWCCNDSTTKADQVTCYSNSASFLNILAPANNAYTTDIVGLNGKCDGTNCGPGIYDYNPSFGGTSAACPYVAGAVACLQQAAKENMGRYLLPSEVKDILTSTGDDVNDPKAPQITKPRLNLGWAIDNVPGLGSSSVVFNDTFSTTDTAKWIFNRTTVDDLGKNEPSGIYSLHLKGGDLATTGLINLSSYTRAILTYHYQRTGGGSSPGRDEDLILEYYDGSNWVELDRQLSNGADMTQYELAVVKLPAEALHSDFRLRIRSAGSSDGVHGDWFVDDVTIKSWQVVFEDSFPETQINQAKWKVMGTIIDAKRQNAPSPPYSLHFNARNSAESKQIDLSSYSGAVLTYHYQRSYFNSANPLIIEYHDGSDWVKLASLPGDESGATDYWRDMRYLPLEALHSEFKFRIRSEGSLLSSIDDWFVDDVMIQAW